MKILRLVFILLIGFYGYITNAQMCNVEWTRGATGNGAQEGVAAATDLNNNIYVAGYFSPANNLGEVLIFDTTVFAGSNNYCFFLAKYSTTGNFLWARVSNVGSSNANGIATDANGNVYITGNFSDSIIFDSTHLLLKQGQFNFFVVKYDSSGNCLWAKTSIGGGQNWGSSIASDKGGNVYISGVFDSVPITLGSYTLDPTGYNGSFFIAKYDPSGNVLWAKTIASDSADVIGGPITTDTNSNVYVAGTFGGDTINVGGIRIYNSNTSYPQGQDIFYAKYNSSGDVVWANSTQGGLDDGTVGIAADGNENLYVTGYFYSDSIGFDSYSLKASASIESNFFLVKYDNSGHALWAKTANSPLGAWGDGIVAELNGNIYVTGGFGENWAATIIIDSDTLTQPVSMFDAMFFALFDPNGKLFSAVSFDAGGDDANGVCLDQLGNVYIGGDIFQDLVIPGLDSLNVTGLENVFVAKLSCPQPSSVIEIPSNSPITVYPNPSTGSYYFKGVQQKDVIEVYDLMGQHIYSGLAETGTGTVDLSGHSAGIYFYKVKDQSGLIQQGKIVLE